MRPRNPAAGAFASAREHRRLMQKGVVVDLLDEEICDVCARNEPACPAARIDQRAIGVRLRPFITSLQGCRALAFREACLMGPRFANVCRARRPQAAILWTRLETQLPLQIIEFARLEPSCSISE